MAIITGTKQQINARRHTRTYAQKKLSVTHKYWVKILSGLGYNPIQSGHLARYLNNVRVKNKKQLREWMDTPRPGGLVGLKGVGPALIGMMKSVIEGYSTLHNVEEINARKMNMNRNGDVDFALTDREDDVDIGLTDEEPPAPSAESLFMEKLGKTIADAVSLDSPELFEEVRKSVGSRIAPAEEATMGLLASQLLEGLALWAMPMRVDCTKEAVDVLECLGRRRYVVFQELCGVEYVALTPAGLKAVWCRRKSQHGAKSDPWGWFKKL